MKGKRKKVLLLVIALIALFFGVCVYFAQDYTRRCVKVTPKKDVTAIEVGKKYSVEDFFLIEREKDTDGRVLSVTWRDGSTENIKTEENSYFTVSEGSGTLTITLSCRNHDSPEASDASLTVTVGR